MTWMPEAVRKKSLMATPTFEQISTIQDLQPTKYVKEAPIKIF